ncbi:MAG TPA: hypothetical protein VGB00_14640 [Pyrinomonadaceae bacterium]|jgi:hypothetical protein
MKFYRDSGIIFVFLTFFTFVVQSAAAQEQMTQPTNFFRSFPEIKWGMSAEKAKAAIEKTGKRAARPVETQLTWFDAFDRTDGRGVFVFSNENSLEAVIVQLYYSEKGKQMYESWLKKLSEKHGEAKEEKLSDDVTLRRWNFKNGFFLELRLVKGEGENRYMTDIHWERIQPRKAAGSRR